MHNFKLLKLRLLLVMRVVSPTQSNDYLKTSQKGTILPCCHGYVILQAAVLTDFNVESCAVT